MTKNLLISLLTVELFISTYAHAQSPSQNVLCMKVDEVQEKISADYTPGVDVHGNPVAALDINDYSHILPNTIQIPIVVDLAERLSVDLPAGTQLEAPIQTVEIQRDGRITMNGEDITKTAQALCSGTNVINQKSEREILNPKAEVDILTGQKKAVSKPVIDTGESDGFIWGEGN